MPEQSSVPFAQLLRLLRTQAGLTQEELAAKAKISTRSISDLERGINLTARGATARLLGDALGLSGQARVRFEAAARGRALPSGDVRLADLLADGGGATENGQQDPSTDASREAVGHVLESARLAESARLTGTDGSDEDRPNPEVGHVRDAIGFAAATRTLPRDIASFTGRDFELDQLIEATSAGTELGGPGRSGVVDVCAVGGMAGIGKSAFAVHAAHRLADRYPDGQIFLSLQGHVPGQQPVTAADALASLLQTIGVAAQQIPAGLGERIRLWRDHLAGRRFLIVLDDAVGHEQVRPLLPGTAGSLVLITSRRHLTALEDAKVISLDTPSAAEAAQMLARLADRPGLPADDPAVAKLIELCGCLPLAIGMAASQLRHHPVWTVADLAADLALSRDRLELLSAENLSVGAAFDLSYRDLDADQQRLLKLIGLHPGLDLDAYAAAALLELDHGAARRLLESLYDNYLLAEPAHGRFRPHDLIRQHAKLLANAEPAADRAAALLRLLSYYLHTARTAGSHLARRIPAGIPEIDFNQPRSVPDLSALRDAVSWMSAERSNLHVAAAYAGRHGLSAYASAIPAAMHGFLRGQGYWDQALILYQGALEAARTTADQLAEASARTDLGDIQSMTGDHRTATRSLTRALEAYRAASERLGEANALHNLGSVQQRTNDFAAARETLGEALALQRAVGNQLGEASVLNNLGSVQYRSGDYDAAIVSLSRALDLQRALGNQLGEANALNELGIAKSLTGRHDEAIADLARALDLHTEVGNRLGEANALRDLGRAEHAAGDYQAAVASLAAALDLQRELGNKFGQANASKDLGIAKWASGDSQAAIASLAAAIDLYRQLGATAAESAAKEIYAEITSADNDRISR